MKSLSTKEAEILLLLVKDFSKEYNPHSITKEIKISHAGAFKAMKKLEKESFLTSRKMGRAAFYKVNLKDYYVFRCIETLLIKESREKAQRWLFEFRELYEHIQLGIIFGSVLRESKKANDIDLLLVFKEEKYKKVMHVINEKNKILVSPIHPIIQTPDDLLKNLKKKDVVILNALKTGYLLHGYEKLLEAIRDVTGN